MRIQLLAKSTILGTVNAKIIDESMGIVGGLLEPLTTYYENYQSFFRSHSEKPDWTKLVQFELKAALETGEVLQCEGGICVDDVEGIKEVDISFCGLNQRIIDMFRQ